MSVGDEGDKEGRSLADTFHALLRSGNSINARSFATAFFPKASFTRIRNFPLLCA